jgi:predicted porin
MKKTLIALAAVAVSSAAMAQVTISGGIGFAYERTTEGDDAALTRFDGAVSNITFSGAEDLGGGLRANFLMNSRLNGVTGASANTTNDTLFEDTDDELGVNARAFQNIWVGLSGGFGQVQVGRFSAASSGSFEALEQWGTESADYATAGVMGSRHDQAIRYTMPAMNGFSGAIMTTLGAADEGESEFLNVRLNYSQGALAFTFAQEDNIDETTEREIGMRYNLGFATVMLLNVDDDGVNDTAFGVRIPMGATTIKAAVRSGDTASSTAFGVDYALSKRTVLFGDVGDVAGADQAAYRVGLRHTF